MFDTKNPMFESMDKRKNEYNETYGEVRTNTATMMGVIIKTLVFMAVALACGFASIYLPIGLVYFALISSFILSIILVFVGTRYAKASFVCGLIYSMLQGTLYGLLTYVIELSYPGIGISAIAGTIAIFFATLFLHSFKIVRATKGLYKFIFVSLLSILIASIALLILRFVSPSVFQSIANIWQISLVILLFMVVLGALMLIADFSRAQSIVDQGLDKTYEWQAAFGLMITTIWIYYYLLRLLLLIARFTRRR